MVQAEEGAEFLTERGGLEEEAALSGGKGEAKPQLASATVQAWKQKKRDKTARDREGAQGIVQRVGHLPYILPTQVPSPVSHIVT